MKSFTLSQLEPDTVFAIVNGFKSHILNYWDVISGRREGCGRGRFSLFIVSFIKVAFLL